MKNTMDICDLHSHILPNADHGSSSVDISLGQLKLAGTCGVSRIIATPHFYPHRDSVQRFLARRNASYVKLRSSLPEGAPEIRLGAEVLICDNIETLPEIEKLCVYGTRVLLLELPFSDFRREFVASFEALIDTGYTAVIAHADRYDPLCINELLSVGALIQLNASALNTVFKSRIYYDWVESGSVVGLGSDIHGCDKRAYKAFSRSINKLGKLAESIKQASDNIWANSVPYDG